MNPTDSIAIDLSARERYLILRYGYPFEAIEAAIQQHAGSSRTERVEVDPGWLEQLLGDLAHVTLKCPDQELQEELNALCERLEAAELHWRMGSGS